MNLTHHALSRMQQRAIPPILLDLLERYGREHATVNGTVLAFDERGREKARRALDDAVSRFDKLDDVYLVEASDSGAVVTVGHRSRRLHRR